MYTIEKERTDEYGKIRTVKVLNTAKLVTHSVIALVVLIVLFGCFGTIDAGERGVHTRLGNVIGTKEPGLYMKLPFIEHIDKISVRTQSVIYEREDPLTAASSDLQDVKIATVTNYHIDPVKVEGVYKQYRTLENHEESVIRPAVRDTVKAISSQFAAGELITRRAEFADKVATLLNERLGDTYVIVEQTNITDIQFSPSFTQAIEAKVTAVQLAEAAKNKLEQVKFEAQQAIEKAKAEAESIRIQAQAINSQGGADYVNLKAIEKWNGILPTQMIPGGTVPFINLR